MVSHGWRRALLLCALLESCGCRAQHVVTVTPPPAWLEQSSGTRNALFRVRFADARTGIVVGWAGTVLRTTDGGAHWSQQASGTSAILDGLALLDSSIA